MSSIFDLIPFTFVLFLLFRHFHSYFLFSLIIPDPRRLLLILFALLIYFFLIILSFSVLSFLLFIVLLFSTLFLFAMIPFPIFHSSYTLSLSFSLSLSLTFQSFFNSGAFSLFSSFIPYFLLLLLSSILSRRRGIAGPPRSRPPGRAGPRIRR